jgi:hypothetical protein
MYRRDHLNSIAMSSKKFPSTPVPKDLVACTSSFSSLSMRLSICLVTLNLVVYLVALYLFQPQTLTYGINGATSYLIEALLRSSPDFLLTFDPYGYLPLFTNLLFSPALFMPVQVWPIYINASTVLLSFVFSHLILLRSFRVIIESDGVRYIVATLMAFVLIGFETREAVNIIVTAAIPLTLFALWAINRPLKSVSLRINLLLGLCFFLISFSKPILFSILPLLLVAFVRARGQRPAIFAAICGLAASFLTVGGTARGNSQFSFETLIATGVYFSKAVTSPLDFIIRRLASSEAYFFIIIITSSLILFLGFLLMARSLSFDLSKKISTIGLLGVIVLNIFGLAYSQPDFFSVENAQEIVLYPHRQTFPLFISLTLIGGMLLSNYLKNHTLRSTATLIFLPAIIGVQLTPLTAEQSPLGSNPARNLLYDTNWSIFAPDFVNRKISCLPATPVGNFIGSECALETIVIQELTGRTQMIKTSSNSEFLIFGFDIIEAPKVNCKAHTSEVRSRLWITWSASNSRIISNCKEVEIQFVAATANSSGGTITVLKRK